MNRIIILVLTFGSLFFTGCRSVNYAETTFPDGRIEKKVKYGVFGFDTRLGGLEIEASKDSKKVKLQDLDTSSQNAFGVIGKLIDKVPSYGGTTTIVNTSQPSPVPTRLPPVRPATNPIQ